MPVILPRLFVVVGGLVPLVLLFGAGCGDSLQSRANTGRSPMTKSTEPDEDTTASRDETSSSSASDVSSNEPPISETSNVVDDETATRSSAAERKTTREITFDTLKFDIEKGTPFKRPMLTSAIEKLEGQRVRIRGYMLPSFQQSGIKQFVLVRDNMECCFGPGAALYDCIIVEMVNGQSCDFSVRPIAVEGVFNIREFKGPDDMHLAIFHLDGERVR